MANKPLTERVTIVANLLIVEDCDGNKVEYEIPCTCEGGSQPGTTPPPLAGSLCGQANWYAFGIRGYLYQIQDNFGSQPDTFVGRHAAIAQSAYYLQLPVSPWVWFMNGYMGALNPTAAANKANFMSIVATNQTNHDILVCIIHDMLEQQGGIFTYEAFVTRMISQGWYSLGYVISAIPLELFMAQIYNLSQDLPPIPTLSGVDFYDCEGCNDVPEPIECPDECGAETCHRLIPVPMTGNDFTVTGYDTIVDFVPPNDGMWWGKDFNPLRIDMGSNQCVNRIVLRSYTPCGAGGGVRSAHYRIEMDDTNVSEFKCSALNTARYATCGDVSAFGGAQAIEFIFDPPILGRHINVVPLRAEVTLVQVDVITCVEA